MEPEILDPAGHIILSVSDLEKSKIFYGTVFRCLGFQIVRDSKRSAAWVSKQGLGIWIRPAAHQEPKYVFEAPGLHHVCFKAETPRVVDDVYDFLNIGIIHDYSLIIHPPKFYQQYAPDYYAVFFTDLDGIRLEVAYY